MQPDSENPKEEEVDRLKNIFGGERGDEKHRRVDATHELPGNREDVSQLFWLLTSSTESPSSTDTPTATFVETTTILPDLYTKIMANQDRTPQDIDLQDAQEPSGMLTTAKPTRPRTAISPFSLPFLNNQMKPYEEKYEVKHGKDESLLLLATSKDFEIPMARSEEKLEKEILTSKDMLPEQSSFEMKMNRSEEKGNPFKTTSPLPVADLHMTDTGKFDQKETGRLFNAKVARP